MIFIDFKEVDSIQIAKESNIQQMLDYVDSKMIKGDLSIARQPGNPLVVFERKKMSDFKASFLDRRWQEQREF